MRPLYLEFCGINSFSERTEVDFAPLLEFGIFGIFGDTGSGKSTILDAIAFALYGNVTRSRSGSIADIVNYRAEKAYVNFLFEIVYEGSKRTFRVEREIRRKNAAQSVRVYEQNDGALSALSEGVRESNALLGKIIGLEQKDFEKCIALPQGEFSQFVRSQRSDRLKLISRLFDLEQYGERLNKKVNAKCAACAQEYKIASTRLEPYAEISTERIGTLKEEIAALEERVSAQKAQTEALRSAEKAMTQLLEKKRKADAAAARFEVLETERPKIDALEKELAALGRAAAVLQEVPYCEECALSREKAEKELAAAAEANVQAGQALAAAITWNAEEADEEIAHCTESRTLAEQAEKAAKQLRALEAQLSELRGQYQRECARREALFSDFDYAKERQETETALAARGGDFYTFAEQEKAALFRGEYAVFVGEISELKTRHPEIAADSAPLIEKYTALSRGERKDLSALKEEYAQREKEKRALNEKLVLIERKQGEARACNERIGRLAEDGKRIKAELEERMAGGMTSTAPLAEISRQLETLKAKRRENQTRLNAARSASSAAESALASARQKYEMSVKMDEQAKERLAGLLSAGGFRDVGEAKALSAYGSAEGARERISAFREEYAALQLYKKEYENVDFSAADEAEEKRLNAALSESERCREETVQELALKREQLLREQEQLLKKRVLEEEYRKARKSYELYERLKKLFEGNQFMDFVAEEYLQNVAGNASGRLLSLTDGRYFLRYEGGSVGFVVGDNFNGGETRGVYTLSGGETFLVSLSLALALSAEICLKSLRPIEFFFLDEGFGTLDERLVGTVMDSLEKLRGEHFAIGIISHVDELKHRIERKLLVEKATQQHGSRITLE